MFNQRLKKIRLQKKATQKEVALAIGISERSYIHYERGEKEPSLKNLRALADYFSVPSDYFTGNGLFAQYDLIIENREILTKRLEVEFNAIDKSETNSPIVGGSYSDFLEMLKKKDDINFVNLLSLEFSQFNWSFDPNDQYFGYTS